MGHPQNHGFKSWSNDWDDVGLPPCLGKSPLEKLNPKVARMAHSQHFAKFLSQAHPSISAWDMPAAHRNMAKPMGTLWPPNKVFFHALSWYIKGLLTTVPPSLEGITFGGYQKHQSSCFLWLVFWTWTTGPVIYICPSISGCPIGVLFLDQPMPGVALTPDPRCGHRSWEATLYDRRRERRRPNSRLGQWASEEMTRSLGLCGIHLP